MKNKISCHECGRFKGHAISCPALIRTVESIQPAKPKPVDPVDTSTAQASAQVDLSKLWDVAVDVRTAFSLHFGRLHIV